MIDPLSTPLLDAYDLFVLDNKTRRFSAKTHEFYRCQLIPFFAYCEAHNVTVIGCVQPIIIRGFLVTLLERQLADTTVNAAARAIRTFLNFCVREELLEQSPFRKVSMPRVVKKILPAFSQQEVQQILHACRSERDKAIILFLLDTGCRASELVNLVGGNVTKQGEVQIRQGKGAKDRTVYLDAKALKQLHRYYLTRGRPTTEQPIWISQMTKQGLTADGLRLLLRRVGLRAGVKHCHPHTFRRTFAIWSLRAGMSIFHLQRLLGHEDITVLRQYLALAQDDLQEAHSKADVVDKLVR